MCARACVLNVCDTPRIYIRTYTVYMYSDFMGNMSIAAQISSIPKGMYAYIKYTKIERDTKKTPNLH